MADPDLQADGSAANSVLQRTVTWSRLISGPSIALVAAAAMILAAQAILLRTLPVEEAGRFALLIAAAEVLAMIADAGQPTLLLRVYSHTPASPMAWRADLRRGLLIASPIVILGPFVAGTLYRLTPGHLGFLFAATLLLVLLHSTCALLAARAHYTHSTLALRMPNVALLLPALVFLFEPGLARLSTVIAVHLAATLVTLLVNIRRLGADAGQPPIPWRERLQGLQYLGASATAVLSDRIVLSLSGLFLTPAALAAFAAMALVVRPFALVRNVLRTVSVPELIRSRGAEERFLFAWTVALAGIASVVAIPVAPALLRGLYGGRYTEGLALVPWLILAGALTLIETVPRSALVGRATHRYNRVYILAIVSCFSWSLAAGSWAIARWGLLGSAVAMFLVNACPLTVSLFYWRRYRGHNSGELSNLPPPH